MDAPDAEVFAEVALDLENTEAEHTVDRVIEIATTCVPCDGASVMLVHGRRIELSAATNDLAAAADRLQVEIGEGPSLEVLYRPESYTIEDIETDTRWRRWAEQVRPLGVRSALSVRLRTHGERVGSLDLYSRESNAFDEDDASIAAIFADHASVAISAAHTELGLRRAIDARHVIGQAQGILMERFDIDADKAFAVLRRYSQDRNIRLRAVAETLVASRALPGERKPPRGEKGA